MGAPICRQVARPLLWRSNIRVRDVAGDDLAPLFLPSVGVAAMKHLLKHCEGVRGVLAQVRRVFATISNHHDCSYTNYSEL